MTHLLCGSVHRMGALSIALMSLITVLYGQSQDPMVIQKAIRDELARSAAQLGLPGLQRPCFISYALADTRRLMVTASLGAIVSIQDEPKRTSTIRLMAGDYQRTNENFGYTESYGWGDPAPLDDSYDGIRTVLWEGSDKRYKEAAEEYERKLSAIRQQNLSPEEAGLPDFAKAPPLSLDLPAPEVPMDRDRWERAARRISAAFAAYPQLFSSEVTVHLQRTEVRLLTSDGIEVRYPLTLAAVRIEAATQAVDGEPLNDEAMFCAVLPEGLPAEDGLVQAARDMADRLTALRQVTAFDDSYSGPVLFEGLAAAELLEQLLFSGDGGLVAKRKPITASSRYNSEAESEENPLDLRFGKKIVHRDLSVRDEPGMRQWRGTALLGSYAVDAEGVRPPEQLVLVDKGVLKAMLNGRTPAQKSPESNGHCRPSLFRGEISSSVGPGVTVVSADNCLPAGKLRQKLLKRAKEEDLDYAIVISKLGQPETRGSSGSDQSVIAKPLAIRRIWIRDGREEPLRSAKLEGLCLKALKRLLAASSGQYVHNTLFSGRMGYRPKGLSGIPASFIVPDGLLLEELDVMKIKRAAVAKLPIVENPVGK